MLLQVTSRYSWLEISSASQSVPKEAGDHFSLPTKCLRDTDFAKSVKNKHNQDNVLKFEHSLIQVMNYPKEKHSTEL